MSDGCAEAHLSGSGAGRSAGDLLNGYQDTALLYAAAKLGLPDLLAQGPKTSEELAAMTKAHAPSLHRILRGLVVVGMCFEEDGRFGLTGIGQTLRTGVEGSLRNQALVCGDQYMAAWGGLVHSAMTGETAFAHVFGVDPWEHRQRDQALGERFNADLNAQTARSAAAIVEAYDFSAFRGPLRRGRRIWSAAVRDSCGVSRDRGEYCSSRPTSQPGPGRTWNRKVWTNAATSSRATSSKVSLKARTRTS